MCHITKKNCGAGVDLLHRHAAFAALLGSNVRLHQPRCLPGTRQAIIREIMAWIFSTPTSPSILWLRGPVGTGKTALAHTVAELCKQQGALIGCFFFARTVFNCSNPKLLFPTLASRSKHPKDRALCRQSYASKTSPPLQLTGRTSAGASTRTSATYLLRETDVAQAWR